MKYRGAVFALALGCLSLSPVPAGAQVLRGFNLRNVFDTGRNLGALQAFAARNLRSDLYPIFASAAPAEWAAAWSAPPLPLDASRLVPPYDVTARDYLSSLGQVVFEYAAGCDGTPGEVAYALWEVGSGLEWINANATRDCLDCLANAWRRLAPRLSAIGRYFPTIAGFADLAQEEADNPPRTAEEIAGYNGVSANLVQTTLTAINEALGDEAGFFACRDGRMIEVVAALPIPGLEVTDLRFYEGPMAGVPQGQRVYAERFRSGDSRVINYELSLTYPPLERTIPFELEVIWYREDGSVLTRQLRTATAEQGWRRSAYWQGWGRDAPGAWVPGVYRVEAFVNGTRLKAGSFAVEATSASATCPQAATGSPYLETHSPGNAVVQWFANGPGGFSCGYLRRGGLIQSMLRAEGSGYTLYRLRNGVAVPDYRLERTWDAPAGAPWTEGGSGWAVEPNGERRPRGSTSNWSGRRPPG